MMKKTPPAPSPHQEHGPFAGSSWVRKRSRSLAQDVVDNIAQRIADGQLSIGEKLPTEAQMMLTHGVSRTVIREALSRLQAGGLVETRHGIGTFVLAPSAFAPQHLAQNAIMTLRDLVAMMELRVSLETEAAALAALRRTDDDIAKMHAAVALFAKQVSLGSNAVPMDVEFHQQVAKATRNRYFEEVYRFMGRGTIPRSRINTAQFAAQGRETYLSQSNKEHQEILDCIIRKDPEGARTAMRKHLFNSRERLRKASGLPEDGD